MTKPKTRVEGLVGDVDIPAEISDEGVVAKAAPLASPEIEDYSPSKRRADNMFIRTRLANMRKMLKTSPVRKWAPPAGYAQFLGKDFSFMLNGFPITVHFNGVEQEFPEPVFDVIQRKVAEAMDSSTPKNVTNHVGRE